MPDETLRAATFRFLAELGERVGPMVFAGYGGPVARLRHALTGAAGDDIEGFVEAEAQVAELRRAWALAAPSPAIFGPLLEAVMAPPPGHEDEWREHAIELLHVCARRDPQGFAAALGEWPDPAARTAVLAELAELAADESDD